SWNVRRNLAAGRITPHPPRRTALDVARQGYVASRAVEVVEGGCAMMTLRFRSTAAISVAALLTGCSKGESKPPVTTLKVFVQPFLSHAPLLVAQEEGYFTEQGLQVEFVRMSDPAAAIPMLINGQLDVVPGGASPGVLNAITRGLPVRAV